MNASCFLVVLALGANAGCNDSKRSGDDDAGEAGNAGESGAGGDAATGGTDSGGTDSGGTDAGEGGGGAPALRRSSARLVPGGAIMKTERFRLIGSMSNGIAEGTSSASANYELHGFVAGAH